MHRRFVLVLALALSLALSLASCGSPDPAPDPGKIDQLVHRYVDALNREDMAALTELLGRNHNEDQIAARVARFGGRDLHDVQVFTLREATDVYVVFLNALAGGGDDPFEAHEIASWRDKRWMLTPYPKKVQQDL